MFFLQRADYILFLSGKSRTVGALQVYYCLHTTIMIVLSVLFKVLFICNSGFRRNGEFNCSTCVIDAS